MPYIHLLINLIFVDYSDLFVQESQTLIAIDPKLESLIYISLSIEVTLPLKSSAFMEQNLTRKVKGRSHDLKFLNFLIVFFPSFDPCDLQTHRSDSSYRCQFLKINRLYTNRIIQKFGQFFLSVLNRVILVNVSLTNSFFTITQRGQIQSQALIRGKKTNFSFSTRVRQTLNNFDLGLVFVLILKR